MSKRELIEAILKLNHTAALEFLEKFPESDLRAYLARISGIQPIAWLPQVVHSRPPLHLRWI